jgi:glycine/D-amino acid oxidase-like deaminating enzyme
MTPDHDFLMDALPNGRVFVCSACSGHGFKFAVRTKRYGYRSTPALC